MARVPRHHFKDCTMQIPDEHIDWFLDELEKRKQEKREHKRQYYLEHKDKILRYNKDYRDKNKEEIQKYRAEHKEHKDAYQKDYFILNREKIYENARQKIQCECGAIICKDSKSRHLKSRTHQIFLNGN